MAKLTLDIKNQTLTVRCDIDRIVENSVNYLEYEINTTSDWNNLSKVVIVTYNNGKNSEAHSNGKIKNQLIRAPGFSISVVGTGTVKDPNTGVEKTLTIPTNEVLVKIYPSGRLSGDNNPSEEPEPGFGERMDRAEAEIAAIKNTIPAEGELDAIRNKNQEIETELNTIKDSVNKNAQDITNNANEIQNTQLSIQQVENNLTTLENSIQEDFDEVNNLIETTNSNLETTNSNLETLSQKVDSLKITSKVENNVLYIYYENILEQKEG